LLYRKRCALLYVGLWTETYPTQIRCQISTPQAMHEDARRRRTLFSSLQKGEQNRSGLVRIVLIAAIYFISGKLGLKLAFLHQSASPVWPPTGIAIALLLLLGNRIWPGIWLGAFLVNITTAGTVATSLAIAGGNTLEVVLAASLVNWFAGGRQAFERAGDFFKFVLLAAALSTAVSAVIGVTSLALGGFAPWNQYRLIWITWWLGDAVSALIVTPLILIWSTPPTPRWGRRRTGEFLLMLAAVFIISLLAFGGSFAAPFSRFPRFLMYPLVVWGAYRFEQRGAISVALMLACVGIWGTLHGFGPFATENRNESLVLLQVFISTVAVTGLVLGAVVSERRQAEEALRRKEEQTRQDLADMALLEQCSGRLVKHGEVRPMLERIVETAIAVTGADCGDLQLLDIESGALVIAAQRGFQKPVLDFFAGTHAGQAACGTAMRLGERVIVEDVLSSELFIGTPARDILVDAGVRAVQSTPLFSRSGELLGVLSTHFSQPRRPEPRQMRLLDLLARQAADFIDRCRSEETLRSKETELRLITDITPLMLTRCSRDRRYVFVNRTYAKMLGRTPEQVAGRPIREIIGDDAYQRILPHVETVLQGRPVEYEDEIAFDGVGPRSLRVAYVPEINRQGEVVGWVESFSDLTERKQAEANALAEQHFSDTIVNSLPGIFYLFDQTGRFLRWNRNFEVVSGYSREEIARMHPLDFFEGQDKDLVRERIQEVFVKGQSDAEGNFISKEGKKTPYYFTGLRLTVGNTPCLTGLGIDITERKRAEAVTREMAAIVQFSDDAIIGRDLSGIITSWNAGAERLYGYSANEAIGKPASLLHPPDRADEERRILAAIRRGETTEHYETVRIAKNGRRIDVSLTISPIRNADGTVIGSSKIARDITEGKRIQAELDRWRHELESRVEQRTIELTITHKQLRAQIEERKRLETEMARAVEREQLRLGHELHDGLGQQLVGISFMMTALCTKLEKASMRGARDARRLETMLLQSVDQTRNLAKGFYPVELERHGLLSALKEMIHSNEQAFGVHCVLESDESSCVDRKGPVAVQLFRIAQEAVHNAMKHARAKQIVVRLATVGDNIVLTIKDNGIGLPPDAGQASGMGLRIMRYRAHLIGGELDVVDGADGGVTVTCSVPCATELSQIPSSNAEPPRPTGVTV
jgi:PAS domain S-box-containing protein